MEILVDRLWLTDEACQSEVSVDGEFFCYGLEPPARDEKPRAIPAGTYRVSFDWSPRFQMVTPHVDNVPGFSEIEIHPGNYPHDTEGCLLVGKTKEENFVGNSRQAWHELMARINSEVPVTITYRGGYGGAEPTREVPSGG